ncbi:MAG TPA: hypothetical protein VF669_12635 [Tepidisphaeraceae bacterium]
MTLELADKHSIDNPTADDLRQHFQGLTRGIPFLILSRAAQDYMQVAPRDGAFHIEYRQGKQRFFQKVVADEALALLESFRHGDTDYQTDPAWRRLTVWNDPYHPLLLWMLVLIVLCSIVGLIIRFYSH